MLASAPVGCSSEGEEPGEDAEDSVDGVSPDRPSVVSSSEFSAAVPSLSLPVAVDSEDGEVIGFGFATDT